MPLLADIFSAGNTAKRKMKAFAADPGGTLEQFVNQLNYQAGEHNRDLQLSADAYAARLEGRTPTAEQAAADERIQNTLAEAYAGPMGMTKFKGIPLNELLYPGRAASNLTSAEKSAITRFEGALKNPAVRRREEMRIGGQDIVTPTPGLTMVREIPIDPSSLVGKRLVPVMGDLSTVGGDVSQIAGVPLSSIVSQQGGRLYPTIEQNVRQGVAWASEPAAASSKTANLGKFAQKGEDVVGVFTGMSPQGIDFSHHMAEGMIRQLPALRVSKDAYKQLNADIRNTWVKDPKTGQKRYPFANFAGVDSPNIEELISTGSKEFAPGALRTAIVQSMSKAKFRDMGFPRWEDTARVMSEPGLVQGEAGRTMFAAKPTLETMTPDFAHRSYSAGIPGQYMGGIASPTGGTTGVPVDLMFPKTIGRMRQMGKKDPQIMRSFQMSHHGEVFDQEALDKLMAYLNQAPAQ